MPASTERVTRDVARPRKRPNRAVGRQGFLRLGHGFGAGFSSGFGVVMVGRDDESVSFAFSGAGSTPSPFFKTIRRSPTATRHDLARCRGPLFFSAAASPSSASPGSSVEFTNVS